MKTKIELTKEQLVALVGKRKAAKAFPEIFDNEELMHEITDLNELMSVADENAPADKYKKRCITLSSNYHWTLMKRMVDGKFTAVLVPLKKIGNERNPMRNYHTYMGDKNLKKVAAKRKYTRKVKQA